MSGNKSLAKEELKKLTDEELENDMNFVVIHGLKLKGGCTRFEVEHVSHNLLLNTGLMLTKK